MTPVETIARGLARAVAHHRGLVATNIISYVNLHWNDHVSDARALLRSLKDQPPHIIDAGMTGGPTANLGRPHDPHYVLNAQLEAMART